MSRVTIDRAEYRRIMAVVAYVERMPRGDVKRPTAPRLLLPTRNAIVTTAIGSRTGMTKGSGRVTLYVDDQAGTGNMVVLQTNVKVWNAYALASPIAVGKWVVVGIVDGLLQVLGGDC